MRRKAGILVLLGMLGGCIAPHSEPEVIDMTATGQAPGSAMTPVGRPRGPAGYQDWAARRSADWPGATGPGAVAQGQPGLHGMPVGGEVAALASRTTPGSPSDYTAARPAGPGRTPAPAPEALTAEPRQ